VQIRKDRIGHEERMKRGAVICSDIAGQLHD
jgi:hypothetical protein